MVKIYSTENRDVYKKLRALLRCDGEIKRTSNGKPYIDGLHFSITHTADVAFIAVGDAPVGIDAEVFKERPYPHILRRFTERERAEISNSSDFLKNWVVKEAYIKMLGATLATRLKRLEYVDGVLYSDGDKAKCNLLCAKRENCVVAVCSTDEIPQKATIERI